MQPSPIPSAVPTSQRPLNGALSGLAAQLLGNYVTGMMIGHGVDPATASGVGTAAGSGASAVLATVGDGARGALSKTPPWWALIPLQLLARIG